MHRPTQQVRIQILTKVGFKPKLKILSASPELLGKFCSFSENRAILMPFGWRFAQFWSHLKELITMIWKPFDRNRLLSPTASPLHPGQVQNTFKSMHIWVVKFTNWYGYRVCSTLLVPLGYATLHTSYTYWRLKKSFCIFYKITLINFT